MRIKNEYGEQSTAKKIATELVEEQIVCGLACIRENIEYDYTEKQHEAIMDQAEKIAMRALIKIDADWKNCEIETHLR
tara:strand:- start:162 stop:395 length:234 start_codon:yes stop_codon:yes gene_type:complete